MVFGTISSGSNPDRRAKQPNEKSCRLFFLFKMIFLTKIVFQKINGFNCVEGAYMRFKNDYGKLKQSVKQIRFLQCLIKTICKS